MKVGPHFLLRTLIDVMLVVPAFAYQNLVARYPEEGPSLRAGLSYRSEIERSFGWPMTCYTDHHIDTNGVITISQARYHFLGLFINGGTVLAAICLPELLARLTRRRTLTAALKE